ncbi:unnamed protein product [Effrenium voratum]|nr:unnamed protein product [Effrenium voratum]
MIRASSERVVGRNGTLRTTLSCVSLASSGLFTETLMSRRSCRSASLSPTPKSKGHGRCSSPRRFASRHVPTAAEELAAHSQVLEPTVIKRFDGLMKHLKRNTDKQDFEKQVLASPCDVLVPEEYDEVLRGEFARHCSFGERLNTELMHSGKWVKMLKELGLVPGKNSKGATRAEVVVEERNHACPLSHVNARLAEKLINQIKAPATVPRCPGPCLALADADIIFQRVLHDTDYGGKRLTYDFFCKALCLVAVSIYPDLDWEAAMGELLNRIAAEAEEAQAASDEPGDFSLDPNVLLVLDHFKPKLHDLFRSFARRSLPGPTDARAGTGTTRLKERSIWKHTQDTIFASRASSCILGTRDDIDPSAPEEEALSPTGSSAAALPAVQECDTEAHEGAKSEEPALPSQVASPKRRAPALPSAAVDSRGGVASPRAGPAQSGQSLLAWAENKGWCSPVSPDSKRSTMSSRGKWSPVANDPYTYACGSPTIKNRRSYMSLEQLFALCKELKIMPDFVSRQAVVRIFKRAQCAGSASAHGGSNFGFLSQEAFAFRFFLRCLFIRYVSFRCFRSCFRFGIAFACRILSEPALRLLDSQPFSLESVTALTRMFICCVESSAEEKEVPATKLVASDEVLPRTAQELTLTTAGAKEPCHTFTMDLMRTPGSSFGVDISAAGKVCMVNAVQEASLVGEWNRKSSPENRIRQYDRLMCFNDEKPSKGKDMLEKLRDASGPVSIIVQRPTIQKVSVTKNGKELGLGVIDGQSFLLVTRIADGAVSAHNAAAGPDDIIKIPSRIVSVDGKKGGGAELLKHMESADKFTVEILCYD